MIELEHSPLGGSSAKRFINCEGSFLLHKEELEDGVFETFESEFAKEGVGAHELGALCLEKGTEPYEYIGQEFNGLKAGWPGGIKLDAVSVYVDHCRGLLAKHNAAQLPTMVRQTIEKTMRAPHIHQLLKGTADYAVWSPALGIDLVDYKNGEGVGVDVVWNEQIMYYVFLLIVCYGDESWGDDIPVRLWIVQPNFYGIFTEPVPWETTVGVIRKWAHDVLLPKMEKLMQPHDLQETDFVLGDWCQFCPVLLDCPKTQKAFETYAAMDEEEFVMMLSDEEISRYYEMREAAMRFKNELEKVVYARKISGAKIPSAKLVPKQVARVWKPGAEAAAKAQFGAKAFDPAKVKSPAGIEKLSSDGAAFSKEWGFKPNDGALTIAPLSDRRAEVSGKSARVFEKFATQPTEINTEDF